MSSRSCDAHRVARIAGTSLTSHRRRRVRVRGDVDVSQLSFAGRTCVPWERWFRGFASRAVRKKKRIKKWSVRSAHLRFVCFFFFFRGETAAVGEEEHGANGRESRAADSGRRTPGSCPTRVLVASILFALRPSRTLSVTGVRIPRTVWITSRTRPSHRVFFRLVVGGSFDFLGFVAAPDSHHIIRSFFSLTPHNFFFFFFFCQSFSSSSSAAAPPRRGGPTRRPYEHTRVTVLRLSTDVILFPLPPCHPSSSSSAAS